VLSPSENDEVLPHFIVKNQYVNDNGSRVALQNPENGSAREGGGDDGPGGFEF
jgi:hypothetical protein